MPNPTPAHHPIKVTGTHNRVLDIDLATRTVTEIAVAAEDRRRYLGGKGLGLRYLYERLQPGVDPLGPDNVLILMMGVLMGTGAPCSSRFAALTKSPLTGLVASSSCGGPFGMALKSAGYDGLILTGDARSPAVLEIGADSVRFREAGELWGRETHTAQAALGLERDDGALVIGPAGEHQVWFANVRSGSRFLGRAGLGAVMGSKHLKALVARGGTHKLVPHDPAGFQAVRRQALAYIRANDLTGNVYRTQGTVANLAFCNSGGLLPVRNFRDGSDPRAAALTGDVWRERYRTKPHACRTCAILCGHAGTYPDGRTHQIPEYESISLLGPNLEIFDTERITEWNERCNALGMDTISAGATLAYVMEAGERGLLDRVTGAPSRIPRLRFGSPEGITEALDAIAHRRDFGDAMADGTRRLAQTYGGADFAIQVKGLDLPGYDPRGAWGQGLAYAVANRGGCHLSASIFAQEAVFGYLNPYTTRAKAEFVNYLTNLSGAVNSLQTCAFTAFAYLLEPPLIKLSPPWLIRTAMQYLPKIAIAMLDIRVFTRFYQTVTGIPMSQRDFLQAGRRINTLERLMATREGITRADDTLPDRLLHEGRSCDPDRRTVPLEPMLDRYYRLAGWSEDGIPTEKTLRQLGL